MIRDAFIKWNGEEEFRHRGKEPGRMENFSDALFALAITLLLISTSPPTTFAQIKRFIYDLLPFGISIVLIILIWHEHFVFFLRYGLRDSRVLVLNTLFLMIVLFYVYPLKFLSRMIEIPVAMLFGNEAVANELKTMIRGEDMGDLMVIYGCGAAAIFFVLALMYRHALKCADQLGLNELEILDTRIRIRTNFLMGIVPVVSVVVALIFSGSWVSGMISGFCYFLYTPVMMIHGRNADRKREALLRRLREESAESEDVSVKTEGAQPV